MTNGNGGNGYTGVTDDSGQIIRVNSETLIIKTGILERLKLVPPFNNPGTTFRSSPARAVMPEHVPMLGCYLVDEALSPDGEFNCAEPRFIHRFVLGFSYIIQDNDTDTIDDTLDAAHHSIMKLLHDPKWHFFPVADSPTPVRIEGITAGSRSHHYGNLGPNQNLMPIAELRMQMTYFHRTYFLPVITDLFNLMHFTVVYPWPQDPARQPIVAEWVLPQDEPTPHKQEKADG
jgi:hypothetical protein